VETRLSGTHLALRKIGQGRVWAVLFTNLERRKKKSSRPLRTLDLRGPEKKGVKAAEEELKNEGRVCVQRPEQITSGGDISGRNQPAHSRKKRGGVRKELGRKRNS